CHALSFHLLRDLYPRRGGAFHPLRPKSPNYRPTTKDQPHLSRRLIREKCPSAGARFHFPAAYARVISLPSPTSTPARTTSLYNCPRDSHPHRILTAPFGDRAPCEGGRNGFVWRQQNGFVWRLEGTWIQPVSSRNGFVWRFSTLAIRDGENGGQTPFSH